MKMYQAALSGWELEMVLIALNRAAKDKANTENARGNYAKVAKAIEGQTK